MMAKPITTLELHYPVIQLFIKKWYFIEQRVFYCIICTLSIHKRAQWTKKCTKNYNARAQLLFCSANLLFGDVCVAVAVAVAVIFASVISSLLTTGRRGKLLKLPTCVMASVSHCLSYASQLLSCTKFQLFLGHPSWMLYEVESTKWPFVCLRGRRAWDIAQPMSRFPSPRPSAERGPGRSLVRSRILLHWWVGRWLNVKDKSEKPLYRARL